MQSFLQSKLAAFNFASAQKKSVLRSDGDLEVGWGQSQERHGQLQGGRELELNFYLRIWVLSLSIGTLQENKWRDLVGWCWHLSPGLALLLPGSAGAIPGLLLPFCDAGLTSLCLWHRR